MPKNRAAAEELVRANMRARENLSAGSRERLVGALADDLRKAADPMNFEQRLLRIEAQIRMLMDAANASAAPRKSG
jgi:hypothetical protein